MTNMQSLTVEEPEFGYGQLLQILWQRIYWFGGALVGSLGLAIIVTLLKPPTYESSMQLLVEPNVSKSISINSEDGTPPDSYQEIELDYVTQLNLMRSKEFVEDVVIIFPDICESGDSQKACIKNFQESLTLSQIEEEDTQTRIFEAVFISNDAQRARQSLKALQHVYLNYNQNQQARRLTEGLVLVNRQIDQVQSDLRNSQQALQQFRQEGGTIDPEKQSLEAATMLEQLVQAQQAVNADYKEAQAQYSAIQQALAINPQQAMMAAKLSQSVRYQGLLEALQTSEIALSERLAVYTGSDPIAQDLQAQRDLQVELLRQESQRLLGSAAITRESDLLANGQLGESGLALVTELINSQIRLSGLSARLTSLAQAQQPLQQQLEAYPALIAQYDRLQPEVETHRASLEQLLQTRQELSNEIAQGSFKWAMVESPDPGVKISPNPLKNLALGTVAGLFLGGLLAYGRESVDTVVRTSEDLNKQTALPLLGVLPEVGAYAPGFMLRRRARQAAFAENDSVLSLVQRESFREVIDLIYKNIQLAATPLKSVMVTSAIAGEGKTTVAVGLALSAARSHKRVLLIDANLRNPTLHKQLGLSIKRGLTVLLASVETPMPVTVLLAGTQIDILTSGPLSEDPVQLLNAHRMKELVARLELQYDLIVFDTSAVLGRVDALQIASLCKGVVLVSRLDRVSKSELSQATTILARVNQIGIVANGSRTLMPVYRDPSLPELASPLNNGAAQNNALPQSR